MEWHLVKIINGTKYRKIKNTTLQYEEINVLTNIGFDSFTHIKSNFQQPYFNLFFIFFHSFLMAFAQRLWNNYYYNKAKERNDKDYTI